MDKSDVGKGNKSDKSDGKVKKHNVKITKTCSAKTPVKSYYNYA